MSAAADIAAQDSGATHARGSTAARRSCAWRALSAVGLTLVIGVAGLMLLPSLLGYHRYVIVSGSMEPAIPIWSVVYDKEVSVADLEVGDVITFVPPPEYNIALPVTHRIVEITSAPEEARETAAAGRLFRTKGDANETPDPWTMTLDRPTQDRVEHDLPYLGYIYRALSRRWVQLLFLGLPALVIAIAVFRALWIEAGIGVREERARASADDGTRR